MDELGFNKIAAAVLGTALVFIGLNKVAGIAVHSDVPEAYAYAPANLDEFLNPVAGAAEEEIILPFPQPEWIAEMDVARGETVFKKCLSCHNAEEGGRNGTGPNLWAVLGRQSGVHPGFKYSAAMASADYEWTYERLDGFLERPKSYLPGTAMNYIGLKKPEDRAAVIAYMRAQGSSDIPLPDPAPIPPELQAKLDGDVPGAEPSSEETRLIEQPQVEDIPGADPNALTDDEGMIAEVIEDNLEAAEDGVEEVEDEFRSAGEVTPDDIVDEAVRRAIPGDEPSPEEETVPDIDPLDEPGQDTDK